MSVKQNEVVSGCFFAFVIVAAWVAITATVCVIAEAQDAAPSSADPESPFGVKEIGGGGQYIVIEKRVRPDKPDRKHRHDEPAPTPQPDQQPGKGETVVAPEVPDGRDSIPSVEGREEREKKRLDREEAAKRRHEEAERHAAEKEKLRQEQEEYDRLHPKPAAPTGFIGFIWSWFIGPSLWAICAPFAWLFTLIKWGGMLFLLILLALLVTAIVFFGSVAWRGLVWLWRGIGSMWSREKGP